LDKIGFSTIANADEMAAVFVIPSDSDDSSVNLALGA